MRTSIICAACLSILAIAPVQAQQFDTARQVVVHYDDINVKQAAGARTLLARIDQASQAVCGPVPDMRELGAWRGFKTCTQNAKDRAVASLPFNLMAALDGSQPNEAVASR